MNYREFWVSLLSHGFSEISAAVFFNFVEAAGWGGCRGWTLQPRSLRHSVKTMFMRTRTEDHFCLTSWKHGHHSNPRYHFANGLMQRQSITEVCFKLRTFHVLRQQMWSDLSRFATVHVTNPHPPFPWYPLRIRIRLIIFQKCQKA